MGNLTIKSPNSEKIWEEWKRKKGNTRKFKKYYKIKDKDAELKSISASQYLTEITKGVIFFFENANDIKPSTKKPENFEVTANKARKTGFFEFKSKRIDKSSWKGEDEVPFYSTLTQKDCPNCNGKGGNECAKCRGTGKVKCEVCTKGYEDCNICGGKGTISINITKIDEKGNKKKIEKRIKCSRCYGRGKFICRKCGGNEMIHCKKCGGTGLLECKKCDGNASLFTYQVRPAPFAEIRESEFLLKSSGKLDKKIKKQIIGELKNTLQNIGNVAIKDEKALKKKNIDSILGYLDRKIWKTVKKVKKEIKNTQKEENLSIIFPIYLIPVEILNCDTEKRKTYEIFALGTEDKFKVYSDF